MNWKSNKGFIYKKYINLYIYIYNFWESIWLNNILQDNKLSLEKQELVNGSFNFSFLLLTISHYSANIIMEFKPKTTSMNGNIKKKLQKNIIKQKIKIKQFHKDNFHVAQMCRTFLHFYLYTYIYIFGRSIYISIYSHILKLL